MVESIIISSMLHDYTYFSDYPVSITQMSEWSCLSCTLKSFVTILPSLPWYVRYVRTKIRVLRIVMGVLFWHDLMTLSFISGLPVVRFCIQAWIQITVLHKKTGYLPSYPDSPGSRSIVTNTAYRNTKKINSWQQLHDVQVSLNQLKRIKNRQLFRSTPLRKVKSLLVWINKKE